MGDLDVVEKEEAIVHGIVPELWADISYMDIRQSLMGLEIPYLDNEGMWAVGLSIQDQLRNHDSVVGRLSERSDPPLGGGQVRRVQCECLVLWVPGGSGFQPSDIGSVTQLGLRVAADDLVLLGTLEEELMLLGSSLLLECLQEHGIVQAVWRRLADELIGSVVLLFAPLVLDRELSQRLGPSQGSFKPLGPAAEVVLGLVENWITLKNLQNLGSPIEHFVGEQERGKLVDVEVRTRSFLF